MEKNRTICPCCGQLRQFPTEPGEWEYSLDVFFDKPHWTKVVVKLPEYNDCEGEEGLRLWEDGKQVWWPSNAAWRKV